jgi:hypothetical protein
MSFAKRYPKLEWLRLFFFFPWFSGQAVIEDGRKMIESLARALVSTSFYRRLCVKLASPLMKLETQVATDPDSCEQNKRGGQETGPHQGPEERTRVFWHFCVAQKKVRRGQHVRKD